MAEQGKGQNNAAGKQFVRFTRESGNRIAKAVRRVEKMPTPSVSDSTDCRDGAPVFFRVGTFTGSWSKASSRTVTIRGGTSTITAYNFFATLGSASGGPFSCAVLKGGTNWVVIAAECP